MEQITLKDYSVEELLTEVNKRIIEMDNNRIKTTDNFTKMFKILDTKLDTKTFEERISNLVDTKTFEERMKQQDAKLDEILKRLL